MHIAGYPFLTWKGTLQGKGAWGSRLSSVRTSAQAENFVAAQLLAVQYAQLVSAGSGYEAEDQTGQRVPGVKIARVRIERIRAARGGSEGQGAIVEAEWTLIAPSGWPPLETEHLDDREVLFP